ncbi:unnamed protein product [Linum trigynum]|uniref:Uncharacterized protein n=1 Tax=Linum trigynum TaxID=586398 RepID=A0AAV2GYT9_9ROSI
MTFHCPKITKIPSGNTLGQTGAKWTYHPWIIGSIDFIVGGEYPRPDSLICSLRIERKCHYGKIAQNM